MTGRTFRLMLLALALIGVFYAGRASNAQEREWPWPDNLDAMIAAPDSHRVLLENEFVRVLEVFVAPGDREPPHTHRWPSAMIIDQTSHIRYYVEGQLVHDPPTDRPLSQELSANWMGPEGLHAVENIGDVTFHAIRVELKETHQGRSDSPSEAR